MKVEIDSMFLNNLVYNLKIFLIPNDFDRYSKPIFIGAQIENLRVRIDIFWSSDKLIFDASNVNFGARNEIFGARNENFGAQIDIFWCP